MQRHFPAARLEAKYTSILRNYLIVNLYNNIMCFDFLTNQLFYFWQYLLYVLNDEKNG